MFLKSLNIKGFKTFAEKEELVFDSSCGITAIVGPNGCGKSNVVDSFRFALGESNIRGLRVHALPEVIFAGTQDKKPVSLAEVTLLFDNTDHSLPIDYSEVSVRRRTFRDGESEFLINNQSSRLKDIRDLFLDSGISTESMSIMSQGNVDAILSSKPEERRSVFEEVAGINKYKFRKVEAERKLIQSEQNLLRISDLKVEIGEQLISLEIQAKAAKEYRDILNNLKTLELSTCKKQARQLLEKKEETAKALDELRQKSKEKEEQKKKAYEDRAEKNRESRELEAGIENILQEIGKIKEEIDAERGNLVLERERSLYNERGKLRDKKEEERFLHFEIKKMQDSLKTLNAQKAELLQKSKEIAAKSMDEFGDFSEIIRLTAELSQMLKKIIVSNFGKSWENLKEDVSAEKFRELLELETARLDSEIASNNNEIGFKTKKLEEIKNSISEAEAQLAGLEKQTEDFLKTPLSQNIEQLAAKKNEKAKELEEMRRKKEALSLALEELEKGTFSSGGAEDNPSNLIKLEIALARIDSELAQIESHVREEYAMGYDDLLKFEQESANIARSKKEIETFKARLRELEPVNLLAIDEYDKCKERHGFIEAQYQDVNSARENLKTLITELDLKAREDFVKSMDILAKNFSEVFSELFAGGEAQIIMEKGKDALEAGIEISVRPAQRKWLNMSLLSGGEKALTAIALLFAILKTTPSPLCILDEVDAALDDSNIGRFADYLKKFAQTSQIIVITHNKQTMAAADTIYGVTMQEPGVSTILSVKLEKTA